MWITILMAKVLALIDLTNLRAVVKYLTFDARKTELPDIGGIARSTPRGIFRRVAELDARGGGSCSGE